MAGKAEIMDFDISQIGFIGTIFSTGENWIGKVTSMNDMDVVGLITIGIAGILVLGSIWGIVTVLGSRR